LATDVLASQSRTL